jgi:hypothetical protein
MWGACSVSRRVLMAISWRDTRGDVRLEAKETATRGTGHALPLMADRAPGAVGARGETGCRRAGGRAVEVPVGELTRPAVVTKRFMAEGATGRATSGAPGCR